MKYRLYHQFLEGVISRVALVRNDEKLELCRLLAVIYNFWITGWNEPWGRRGDSERQRN